uniref:Amino acid transporter n=1 Tax=Hymenolepis diminuta TaxID=6216 RepID=A0A0R3SYC1_HYMDI
LSSFILGSYVLNRAELHNKTIPGSGLTASDIFKDIVYNLFPENIMGITIFQYRTEVANTTKLVKYGNSNRPGTNMIGIMFCAFVFGAAANAIGPTARPLITFFNSVAATVTKVMNVFLLFTPVGVCFMVTSSVIDRTNIESDFIQLGIFAATVIGAILIHLILHVLVLSVVSRRNPLRLFKYSFNSFLITFATTSTAASMGEMYIELDRYGCNKLASRFVLPVCLVIKGDGPAIFISAACMFVVQQTGFEIDSSKVIFIVDRCRSGFSGLSVMFIAASTSAFFERYCDKIDDSGLEHLTGGNDGDSNCDLVAPHCSVKISSMSTTSFQLSSEMEKFEKPRNKCVTFLINNWFMLLTLLGVIIGFTIGFGVGTTNPDTITITWISMIGDIYLRILQLTILPLIASNILVVIASLEPKKNGAISIVGICYIVSANFTGSLIGTAYSCIIKPGTHGLIRPNGSDANLVGTGLTASDIFKDMFYNFFPDNIIGVTIFQYRTEIVNYTTYERVGNSMKGGTNMVGVLFCAIAFGAAANAAGEIAKPMIQFFKAVSATVTRLMTLYE